MEDSSFDLLKEIISFIENIYGDVGDISNETRIEEDLRITGDEAVEFILKYGKSFDVDVSNFLLGDYFKGEGEDWDFLSRFLEGIGLKKRRDIKKILTIEDLIKGAEAGKLDEGVLNK